MLAIRPLVGDHKSFPFKVKKYCAGNPVYLINMSEDKSQKLPTTETTNKDASGMSHSVSLYY